MTTSNNSDEDDVQITRTRPETMTTTMPDERRADSLAKMKCGPNERLQYRRQLTMKPYLRRADWQEIMDVALRGPAHRNSKIMM